MKTKIIYFALLILLFTASCTVDDGAYPYSRNKLIKVPNLIHIETQNQYHLNDTLFVNIIFSRYLSETGFADSLDIFKTTLSDKFNFGFGFSKETAYGNWAYYDINGSLIITKGVYNQYALAAVYNSNTKEYELRFGIPLKETGKFKLHLNHELMSNYYNYNYQGVPVTIATSVYNPGVNIQYNNSEYTFQIN